VAAAGFAQGRTGAHGGDDGGLDALDLCRGGCDLFGSLCRHDNDSVLVGAHHVAGADGDAIDEQRLLHRAYSHPILAGAHEPAGAPDPVVGGRRHRDVAAHPVDHGACDLLVGGDLRHDAAPHCAVGAARVVDENHRADGDVVEEVTHGAAEVIDRLVGDRVGGPTGALPRPERGDAVH
jgi:hypothetical protein